MWKLVRGTRLDRVNPFGYNTPLFEGCKCFYIPYILLPDEISNRSNNVCFTLCLSECDLNFMYRERKRAWYSFSFLFLKRDAWPCFKDLILTLFLSPSASLPPGCLTEKRWFTDEAENAYPRNIQIKPMSTHMANQVNQYKSTSSLIPPIREVEDECWTNPRPLPSQRDLGHPAVKDER